MENREEINKIIIRNSLDIDSLKENAPMLLDCFQNAMQEYADQQNKAQLEEIERLKSKVSNWMDKYTEVNEENKQLQTELDNLKKQTK